MVLLVVVMIVMTGTWAVLIAIIRAPNGNAFTGGDAFSEPPRTRGFLLKLIASLLIYLYYDYAMYFCRQMYFCQRGVELGLSGEEERDRLIEEVVAGTPRERPAEHVYQAF